MIARIASLLTCMYTERQLLQNDFTPPRLKEYKVVKVCTDVDKAFQRAEKVE